MTRINQAWYTQEDQVTQFHFRLMQEQLDKDREKDENIKKMLTQMEVLQEHMKGTCGLFRVEEGSSSGYSRPEENQGLKKNNEDENFKKFLLVFQKLSINLPLVEALLEMPGYAKFMKELVTKKRNLDCETIEVSHNCSAIMTKELITKREDPGEFTIPCTIVMLQFAKALCNLGKSINLMPYAIYKQLGLGEPKATTMRLLMADRSINHPVGILYDILVKVDRFIFSANFVILDCEIDGEIPIILGRPFLGTGRALVDVESGKLKFRVNDDEVIFNICKSMKHPSDIHVVSTEDVIDEVVASVSHLMCMNEPLESVLTNYDESEVQGYEEVVAALTRLGA
ncbi:uncharacterized protein LOC125861442 [Solanum stenotomum]|uniref:uncharacterized protein LOC125861442 n=1 Tax=Solanum stenotomum TaxID=172797 RepID=UPI0020D0AB25|nr:uncharacterized protein LOC125861442 [Solanum stenotomum]